ncbi:hypothetical protein ABW20_dc0104584 [Dactylellina cionopaga]|nr:hypothetical protein ABW20_dc0104584 [Dactylellina cionopaga]
MAWQAPDSHSPGDHRPTVSDLHGNSIYSATAKANWLKEDAQVRFSSNVVKDIYKALELESFSQESLLLLENLQYVERYLWPNYNEDSIDELVISIVMMAVVKSRENINIWSTFETESAPFPSFFRRVLIMSLSTSLSILPKTHILCFILSAFQSLETPIARKECAPLVSIGIWQNFHSDDAREIKLKDVPLFKKAWRAAVKKLASADHKLRAKLHFERSWLYLLVLDFVPLIYTTERTMMTYTLYSERMIELFTDLLSQLPTRRYVRGLLEDLLILPCIRLSPLYASTTSKHLRQLVGLLEHFYYFEDDSLGEPDISSTPLDSRYRQNITKLQQESLRVSKTKLMILGLANYASIAKKDDLELQISVLNDSELGELYQRLSFRQSYPQGIPRQIDRQFMLCAIVEAFVQRPSVVQTIKKSSLLPTEDSLFDESLLPNSNYNGAYPLPIPKLNLQYLSMTDFLWRMFFLYRAEAFFEIRRDLQDTLRKIKPKLHHGNVTFAGKSKMAMQINRISIVEVAQPQVSEISPAYIRAELDLPFDNVTADTRQEWEALRSDDVVFLLSIRVHNNECGTGFHSKSTLAGGIDIGLLRCAEIIHSPVEARQYGSSSNNNERRKLHVRLDRMAYLKDMQTTETPNEIYDSLNLIIRRKGNENNFKSILSSIQSLAQDPRNLLPQWLQDTYLGCGDPTEACFPKLRPIPKRINFGDTFHDIQHLQETLREKPFTILIPAHTLSPPFVLTEVEDGRRARDTATGGTDSPKLCYDVSSFKNDNSALDQAKGGKRSSVIRHTDAQVEAIVSATNTGVSLIIGPPGTGKTDVAAQIICNLYQNFPNERTLVIAHSNQALNQLFQKIAKRDIDERHLLRLGHGEDELQQPESSYSKFGRIESLAELRHKLLQDVDQLAASINAHGAHGNSCETASYFNQAYIKPIWNKFKITASLSPKAETVVIEFPFYNYFSGAHDSLLQTDGSFESAMHVAESYFEQISKIFVQLDDIMPFDILRNGRDKANYLLTKEARIIAMTSTYAAIKRDEILRQGFRYDNIVMEEAAQITEVETFIPLTLQKSTVTETPLKRIVLCGDHLQNSPVIQHTALRYFANMEQSLFARFIRLGVPSIKLDKQGRARPSIASLYNWRYPGLGNLDYLYHQEEFLHANAGFKHEYQFINVEDFKGHGEQEPSPHFIQNLGEAEYAVALFQYMRLLGYPASKISILSSYAGQRALIRDIINHRCAANPIFGSPGHLTTIDKFQGEQNDYVIVSLVRTNHVGYLRDVRRLTVALSRARLGLYVLGRLKTFQLCYELKDAFSRLLQNPIKLELVTGEMWPTDRLLTTLPEGSMIESVEHMGKFVFEMTETKMASLKGK